MANCTVSGTVVDPSATAVSGATIRAKVATGALSGTSLVVPTEVTTTTAANGTWSLSLIQGLSVLLTVEFPPNSTDSLRRSNYTITIPALTTANFSTLATEL